MIKIPDFSMYINKAFNEAAEISIKNDSEMLIDCVNKMFITKSEDELCTLYIRAALCIKRIFIYHKDLLVKG